MPDHDTPDHTPDVQWARAMVTRTLSVTSYLESRVNTCQTWTYRLRALDRYAPSLTELAAELPVVSTDEPWEDTAAGSGLSDRSLRDLRRAPELIARLLEIADAALVRAQRAQEDNRGAASAYEEALEIIQRHDVHLRPEGASLTLCGLPPGELLMTHLPFPHAVTDPTAATCPACLNATEHTPTGQAAVAAAMSPLAEGVRRATESLRAAGTRRVVVSAPQQEGKTAAARAATDRTCQPDIYHLRIEDQRHALPYAVPGLSRPVYEAPGIPISAEPVAPTISTPQRRDVIDPAPADPEWRAAAAAVDAAVAATLEAEYRQAGADGQDLVLIAPPPEPDPITRECAATNVPCRNGCWAGADEDGRCEKCLHLVDGDGALRCQHKRRRIVHHQAPGRPGHVMCGTPVLPGESITSEAPAVTCDGCRARIGD